MSVSALASRRVRVRHLVMDPAGQVTVLGQKFMVADVLDGAGSFASGTIERRLYEEGAGTLRLANAAGADGAANPSRFRCLTDPGYLPGDEWFEVWEDTDLLGVWTPTGRQSKRRSEIQLAGEDATTLLKRTREGTVGYWRHAPRDAIEHYGRAWKVFAANDFDTPGEFTYSSTDTASSDGQWRGQCAETDQAQWPGAVRLRTKAWASDLDEGFVYRPGWFGAAGSGSGGDQFVPWRIEAEVIWESSILNPTDMITFYNLNGLTVELGVNLAGTQLEFRVTSYITGGGPPPSVYLYQRLREPLNLGEPIRIAAERRDRWAYFFVNGSLLGVLPQAANPSPYTSVECGVRAIFGASTTSYLLRRLVCRYAPRAVVGNGKGDLHLPGVPAPGGLAGQYFDCQGLYATMGADAQFCMLDPTLPVAASRFDQTIAFPASNPPAWAPAPVAGAGRRFSARWTGSIYLDLDAIDRAVRVTADDECVVWIANTRGGEQILTSSGGTTAPSTWLKAGSVASGAPSGSTGPLAGRPSGWYPIVIEYKQAGGTGSCTLEWESSAAVGTWTTVPSNSLSPYGCYDDLVRGESHYDALKNIADTFGYQWTCEPRALESGEFPGRIVPRVRVGRDTEKVLGEPDAVDIQADLDLDSRADLVTADASGIADQTGVAQLSAEMLNIAGANAHPYVGVAYESLSDISNQRLLEQRLSTLLTLRSAVWEEVSGRPPGRRELLDSWPLTGTLAEFAWAPGDGIRLDFPSVGVQDAIPRQILGLSRGFTPAGVGPPAASFRPRPRSAKSLLREVRRAALLPQRNYQQQLAQVSGSIGSTAGVGGTDAYSRIALPANPADLVRVELVVLSKGDASDWNIEVDWVNTYWKVNAVGRTDITGYMIVTAGGLNFARLVTTGTSTGAWSIQIVATVRV